MQGKSQFIDTQVLLYDQMIQFSLTRFQWHVTQCYRNRRRQRQLFMPPSAVHGKYEPQTNQCHLTNLWMDHRNCLDSPNPPGAEQCLQLESVECELELLAARSRVRNSLEISSMNIHMIVIITVTTKEMSMLSGCNDSNLSPEMSFQALTDCMVHKAVQEFNSNAEFLSIRFDHTNRYCMPLSSNDPHMEQGVRAIRMFKSVWGFMK
ncbi:hypothetical protein CSKR_105823 [Clonorchis sinensis]|uniref:Uncharacterized protein n=2 Tax=Clonorchis sinensis TaxID=79923 RepID=A0A8T1MBC8_CLOSI|nr:hypothetical protein CSKR_105823 [Clonorchis sinensis]GAA47808.1 hypothetical protein CLF_100826 [Clonorchis sinensis]